MWSIVIALWLGSIQTSSEWQTYRNALYGYELRHPDRFEVMPTGPEDKRDGRSIRVGQRDYAAPTPVLHVYVGEASESIGAALSGAADLTASTDPVDVAGKRGRRTVYRWRVNGDIFMVDVRAPGVVLILETGAGTREIGGTVWDQIISSFRFSTPLTR